MASSIAALRVGDRFVYTRMMNEGKLRSKCASDASELIGKEVTVKEVARDSDSPTGYAYHLREDQDGRGFHTDVIDNLLGTPITNQPLTPTLMTKLNSFMKRLLDKDTQTLVEAGYINGDLLLTPKGKEALDALYFADKKAELVKLAEEDLKEEKSK